MARVLRTLGRALGWALIGPTAFEEIDFDSIEGTPEEWAASYPGGPFTDSPAQG